MNKCFSLLLIAVISLTFSSCDNAMKAITDDGRNGTENLEKTAKVNKISFFTCKTESMDFFGQLFKDFQKETGIIVEAEYNANSYYSVLAARTAVNEMPDVFTIFPGKGLVDGLQRLGMEGYLLDITNEPFVDGYLQSVNEEMEVDGKLYSICCDVQVLPVLYNKKLFKQVGITKTPDNINEWWDVCARLKAGNITPMASNAKDEGWFFETTAIAPSIVFAKDMDWQEKRDKGEAKWKSEPWEKVFGILKEMLDKGYIVDNPLTYNYADSLNMFASSKTAMLIMGSWEFENIKRMGGDGFEYGAFFFPGNEPGEKLVFPGSIGDLFAISAKTEYPEESKKLLAYFTKRNQDMQHTFGGFSSLENSSEEGISSVLNEFLPDFKKYKSYTFMNNKWPQDFTLLNAQQSLMAGEKTIAEVLADLDVMFDDLYNKDKKKYN